MNVLIKLGVVAIICLLMTGCASIIDGTQQSVMVKTKPMNGARCTLENSKGSWAINDTPEQVIVHRDYGDLHVVCRKGGLKSESTTVKSHTKGWAFGNIIFGGLPGIIIDMASGAAYDYPSTVNVKMHKIKVKAKTKNKA